MKKNIVLIFALMNYGVFLAARHTDKSYRNTSLNLDIKNMSPYRITINNNGAETIINRNMLERPVNIAVGDTVRITARVRDQDISNDFNRTSDAERVWYVHVYQEPHKATMSIKIEKANTYR
jgi:hypothetical protein